MTRTRILRLLVLFAVLASVLIVGLLQLMVADHDEWLERSYRNRWAFRDVPTRRGSIRARDGQPLVWDEPGVDLEFRYRSFRREHPVGVAVHGANLLEASLGRQPSYSFGVGAERLFEACTTLLRTPIGLLGRHAAETARRHGAEHEFSGEDARDLRFYVSSLLSTLSGVGAYRFHLALRLATEDRRDLTVYQLGQEVCAALPREAGRGAGPQVDPEVFRASVRQLEQCAVRLAVEPGLFEFLDDRRAKWQAWTDFARLAKPQRRAMRDDRFWRYLVREGRACVGWRDFAAFAEADREQLVDGFAGLAPAELEALPPLEQTPGVPWNEDVPYAVVRRMPYPHAVWLRLIIDRHPGLSLQPSVRRVAGQLPMREDFATLSLLLGTVSPLWAADDDAALVGQAEALGRRGVEEFLDEWPEDLPRSFGDSLVRTASHTVRRHYLTRGRIGRGGVEQAVDDELRGAPGLRFVERDRRREQRLFSALDVDAGKDVTLTIDLELQQLLEACVEQSDLGAERAAAILDARTGEILAIAGAPRVDEDGKRLYLTPALFARGNAAIGSVAKPFITLEHLDAKRRGRPHAEAGDFRSCAGKFGPGLRCSHNHYDVGLDPVESLSQSCNFYFYSAIRGLGQSGLINAYRRVGWTDECRPGETASEVYCAQVEGLSGGTARPSSKPASRFEQRAIGYGVNVNTVFVARAYAALATGFVMLLRIVRRATYIRHPLDVHADDLEVVRLGLSRCITHGTASKVTWPAIPLWGKTGTAEVGNEKPRHNNAWFAGFTAPGRDAQLAFAAVNYDVPSGHGGGGVAAPIVATLLTRIAETPELAARYLPGVR